MTSVQIGGQRMTDQETILVVDDTPASLKLLTDILAAEGYDVRSAIRGELALRAAASDLPALILLDIHMPEMDGYEVCRRLKADPVMRDTPVIFVSAASETDEKVVGFRLGAVDYVSKPFQREELLARVHTHLELNRLRRQLESRVMERTAELRESQRNLKMNLVDSITALASTLEMRDPYTAGHQKRVAHLAVATAREMNLDEDYIEAVNLAAIVHDVGKIQVPSEILSKPGRLSEIEFSLIKQHPQSGYEILKTINFPWPIAQIVLQHHERMDGSGYPQGLRGNAIPLESRIIAVADVIEAMASHRPYRPGLGVDAAIDEIGRFRGVRFDAQVVDACVALFKQRGYVLPTQANSSGFSVPLS